MVTSLLQIIKVKIRIDLRLLKELNYPLRIEMKKINPKSMEVN